MTRSIVAVFVVAWTGIAWGDDPSRERLETLTIPLADGATLADGLAVEMIGVPAGEFVMGGSPGDERASVTEEARRRVRLSRPFYLGRHEITDVQWRLVMGKSPEPATANLPAAAMTWREAKEFTAILNKTRRKLLPEGMVFRLPTEAEWEYAARAGTTAKYHFGDDPATLGDYAWFRDNATHTMPVGRKKPNAWGFHDITGNVEELCLDYFLPDARTTEEVLVDPINLTLYPPRYAVVTRGGSYVESAVESRISLHSSTHYVPKKRPNVGFRLAIGRPYPEPAPQKTPEGTQ